MVADVVSEETRVTEYGDSGYAQTTYARPVRPGRRRRGLSVLAAFLIAIAAVLVVGDRVAAKFAAGEIETRVVAELNSRGVTADRTEVGVDGFPFLTQVAEGRYDKITVDMTTVRLKGATLPQLNVIARDVTADTGDLINGTATVVADRVSGTGTVDYASLATIVDYGRFGLSGVTFADAGGGGLRVRGTAQLQGGLEVPLAATAELTAVNGGLRIRVRDIDFEAAQLPAATQRALDSLARRLSVDVPIPALPFNLSLDQVRVEGAGLSISATARSVPLAS